MKLASAQSVVKLPVVLLAAVFGLIASANLFADDEPIDFNRDIRPILSSNCFACHGFDSKKREAGLRLDTSEGATAEHKDFRAIVPGKPEASRLLEVVSAEDKNERMPPAGKGRALTADEIATLRKWIGQGAPYAKHWAYVAPKRPAIPSTADPRLQRNPIDPFIATRLSREGLKMSPEADRYTLIRRLSLDITGLPPTIDQVDAFVNDKSPDAYEKVVDRLLASPAYGERWAKVWLDLARYADSAGYADDPPRTIWAYRDYVIRAFNDNVPFDQFTIDQLAGDLRPNPTDAQLIATAFHRNTQTNNEGGTDDEEFRNVAIVDRVNTTFEVWMGTTMACAQCHDHKYDPISQEDYFRFYAILNNTADADRRNEAPVHEVWDEAAKQKKAALRKELAAKEKKVNELTAAVKKGPSAGDAADGKDIEKQAAEMKKALDAAKKAFDATKKKYDAVRPRTTVPIFEELAEGKRRKTHIQYRGSFLDKGPEVHPGIPATFLDDYPKEEAAKLAKPTRLDMARWLVDEKNPMTARVVVNRYWEKLFGNGIVVTSEEFGSQGELPSHPQLLDWLATELVRTDWDLKNLVKLMVMSQTYRQSARVTSELLERDPDNRLYARGPRFRLTAEMIRDQALFVSGLLSSKMYGPPVRPPQPNLGLKAAFGSGTDWKTSTGEDRYRRGIYTYWRRSSPYPSMTTFDAPSREVCTTRRSRTNTPLQALVTLNDPVFVEAAQALARRMAAAGKTDEEKAAYGFRLCAARPPSEKELRRLVALYREARVEYDEDNAAAVKMATDPLGPLPEGASAADLAAWTVVGNVLLNLDELLMKR